MDGWMDRSIVFFTIDGSLDRFVHVGSLVVAGVLVGELRLWDVQRNSFGREVVDLVSTSEEKSSGDKNQRSKIPRVKSALFVTSVVDLSSRKKRRANNLGSTFFRFVPDDDETETEVNFRSNSVLLPCPEEKCRHIRFGPMTVREYEVVRMPDHKESCCLLSLGWGHSPDMIYESTPERTRSKARRLSFSQRRNRLAAVQGQGWTTAQKQRTLLGVAKHFRLFH